LKSAVPVTGAAKRDKEYISKVGEGERKESKIFGKQIQNKKRMRGGGVIAWIYYMVKLPRAGMGGDKKNTGTWSKGQGKTKRQRRLKDENNKQLDKN
jgi:hypothetical protein